MYALVFLPIRVFSRYYYRNQLFYRYNYFFGFFSKSILEKPPTKKSYPFVVSQYNTENCYLICNNDKHLYQHDNNLNFRLPSNVV